MLKNYMTNTQMKIELTLLDNVFMRGKARICTPRAGPQEVGL